ncbi:hypothetical protein [Persephonella sp.]
MYKLEQVSLKTFQYATVLSSKYVLKELLRNFYNFDSKDLKELLFIELRRNNPLLPDYVYKNTLEDLKEKSTIKNVLFLSFDKLSEQFIVWQKNNIYVREDKFVEWQNLLTLISPLQLIIYFFWKNKVSKDFIIDFFSDKYSTLPSYYDPQIEYEIENRLVDLHIHLNGTSETEYIWIDALGKPYEFIKELRKSYSKETVKELYRQFDIDFSPSVLFRLLKLSRRIREFLVSKIKDMNTDGNSIYEHLPISKFDKVPFIPSMINYPYTLHPYQKFEKHENPLVYEALFLYDMFQYLNNKDHAYLNKIFYLYLLLKAVLNKFLVQQLDQYGFDQFQKITLTEIREYSEKNYKIRFLQLNSLYGNHLKHLEGRFAPKSDWVKLKKLVDKIISDYETLKKQRKINYSLALVSHFIKKPDERKTEAILTYRHYKLRQEMKKQALNLWNLIRWNPKKYLKYIRGIDAAANELHAPPEVFAPAFRFLRRRLRNLPHFYINDLNHNLGITFHAGEDFIHIVSGIRYIFEALKFINMSQGDRIGHATAIGIDPDFWRKKIGNSLRIKRGEWLDNLIFVYHMLRDENQFVHYLYKIEKEIEEHFWKIYRKPVNNINILIEAYLCRAIDPDPKILNKEKTYFGNKRSFIYQIDEEELDFEKILGFSPHESSLDLYRKYHQGEYIKRYEEIIEIDSMEVIDSRVINFLQNKMVKILNSRGIAIETMPTSNVRISFYDDYKQHHIYRWLYELEEQPILVVCSDDPGIFSTTLRNEIFIILKNIPAKERIKILETLLKNSYIYSF